jgi:hypothetical protein
MEFQRKQISRCYDNDSEDIDNEDIDSADIDSKLKTWQWYDIDSAMTMTLPTLKWSLVPTLNISWFDFDYLT